MVTYIVSCRHDAASIQSALLNHFAVSLGSRKSKELESGAVIYGGRTEKK